MKLKKLCALALLIPFAWPRTASAQKPDGDLAKVLPADTLGVIEVRDLSAILSIDAEGAIRKLLAHKGVKDAFSMIYDSFDWLENDEIMLALDLQPKEIVRMLNGRLVIALPALALQDSKVSAEGDAAKANVKATLELEPTRGVAVLLDLDVTPDRFEELLHNTMKLVEEKKPGKKYQVIAEEYEGMKIWQVEVEQSEGKVKTPVRFAFRDGLLVASDKKETIEDILDRVKNGSPEGDRLSEQSSYVETLARVGKSDLLIHFNVEQLMPLVNTLIEHEIEDAGAKLVEYVSGPNLVAALGLDAFQSFFIGLDVRSDEVALSMGYTQESRERGLAELMAYNDRGIELPGYFNSGLQSASVSAFDFTKLYHLLMDMVQKASPYAYRVATTQLDGLERSGFPIRNAVLENTDGYLAEMIGYPDGFVPGPDDHPSQTYILRVKDAKSLSEAITKFVEMSAADDPIEFMNEFIYKMPLPIPMNVGGKSPEIAFALVENYLVVGIGDAKMVENTIEHIKKPGKGLVEDKVLMKAFDDLPDDHVVGIGWIDVGELLTNVIRTTREVLSISDGTTRRQIDGDPKAKALKLVKELPDMHDLDYFIVSKTYRTPETFVARMLLRRGR